MSILPCDPAYGPLPVDTFEDIDQPEDVCDILGCEQLPVRGEDYCDTHLIEIEAEEREDFLDYLRDKRRDDAMTDEINGIEQVDES